MVRQAQRADPGALPRPRGYAVPRALAGPRPGHAGGPPGTDTAVGDPPRRRHRPPTGSGRGGPGRGPVANLHRGQQSVTVEIKVNFIGAVRDGLVTVEAVPLHRGRSTMIWE